MNYIGDPDFQNNYWEMQDLPDNCAVAAQTSIINQFLDDDVSLEESTYVAFSNGWYQPGFGTSVEDSGKPAGGLRHPLTRSITPLCSTWLRNCRMATA